MTQFGKVVRPTAGPNRSYHENPDKQDDLPPIAHSQIHSLIGWLGDALDAPKSRSTAAAGVVVPESDMTLRPAEQKLLEIFLEASGDSIDWQWENLRTTKNSEVTAEQLLECVELRFETEIALYSRGSSCTSNDDTYTSQGHLVAYLKNDNPWGLQEMKLGEVRDLRSAFGTIVEIQSTMGPAQYYDDTSTTADIFNVSGKNNSWQKALYMDDEEISQIKPQAATLMMEAIGNLLDRVQKREAVKVDTITW